MNQSNSPQANTPTLCRHCAGKSHGPANFKTMSTLCPALNHQCTKCKIRGHYEKACYKCSNCGSWCHSNKKSKWCEDKEDPDQEVGSMLSAMTMQRKRRVQKKKQATNQVLRQVPSTGKSRKLDSEQELGSMLSAMTMQCKRRREKPSS